MNDELCNLVNRLPRMYSCSMMATGKSDALALRDLIISAAESEGFFVRVRGGLENINSGVDYADYDIVSGKTRLVSAAISFERNKEGYLFSAVSYNLPHESWKRMTACLCDEKTKPAQSASSSFS